MRDEKALFASVGTVTSRSSPADADVARGRANDPPACARTGGVVISPPFARVFTVSIARRTSRAGSIARERSRGDEGRILARERAPAREDDADVAIERASTPIERTFGRESFSPSISRGRARETRDARARRDARVPTRSRTDPSRGGALLFDESCLVNVSPATRE